MYYLLVVIFISISSNILANTQFQREFGSSNRIISSVDIELIKENKIISYVYLNDVGSVSIGLIVLDSNDFIYRNIYLNSTDTSITPLDIKVISDSIVYVLGRISSQSGFVYPFVSKFDSNVELLKFNTYLFYKTSTFHKLDYSQSNHSLYVIGNIDTIYLPYNRSYAGIICRLDSGLNLIQSKTISAPNGAMLKDIKYFENHVYVSGLLPDTIDQVYRSFIAMFDLNLNMIWQREYFGVKYFDLTNIYVDSMGIYCSGLIHDSVYSRAFPMLAKFDSVGNIVWVNEYVSLPVTREKMLRCSDGGFLISTMYPLTHSTCALIKVDSSGNLKWSYHYNNTDWQFYNILEVDFHQYYLISDGAGYFNPTENQVKVMKTDSLGNLGCNEVPFAVTVSQRNVQSNILNLNILDYLPLVTNNTFRVDSLIFNSYDYCFGYLGETPLEEFSSSCTIYPNPASDEFHISSDLSYDYLEIFDAAGKKLLSFYINDFQSTFNTRDLINGIYFIRMKDLETNTVNNKILFIIR